VMDFVGHSSAQMPQPLQYSRFTFGGMVLEITTSGQNSQQIKQASLFLLQGIQRLGSCTGRSTRHDPVFPPSPGPDSL